jgi:hypothetical protein
MNTHLKSVILDDASLRYVEIYKIVNSINGKIYIGQAVSHILNHKRYRPYGMDGRFKCHISEAFSQKKNQCYYLNNAIRKYGSAMFKVELIETCSVTNADSIESKCILEHKSIYPTGYNLKIGGTTFRHTDESKKRVASGLKTYNKNSKLLRFKNITINAIDIDKYIHPLNRYGIQYGWYTVGCRFIVHPNATTLVPLSHPFGVYE